MYRKIISCVWEFLNMEIKEILDPKKLIIAAGVMVIIFSCIGIANAEQWAEWAWDDEPITDHDTAYEQMWALHMIPVGIFAIATGLFVTGKPLAQMAMASSATVLVVIGGGMGYMTGHHGYDGTPPAIWMIIPLLAMLTTLLLGISGYLSYKDLTASEEA
jgi:urocanate hydratase